MLCCRSSWGFKIVLSKGFVLTRNHTGKSSAMKQWHRHFLQALVNPKISLALPVRYN